MLWDLTGVPLGTVVLPSNVDFFARPRTTFLSFGGEFHGFFFQSFDGQMILSILPPSLSSFPPLFPFLENHQTQTCRLLRGSVTGGRQD